MVHFYLLYSMLLTADNAWQEMRERELRMPLVRCAALL